MKIVKLTFPYPTWDLIRQTPDSLGVWGDYKFYINENIEECDYWVVFNYLLSEEETTRCSAKNTIFLTGEATSIQSYDSNFMNQFQYVITCQRGIKHKNVTYFHQGHPWHIGRRQSSHKDEAFTKSFSELISLEPPKKKKKISIIASDVQITEGHVKRYEFAKALKAHFKDDLDWFGRGVNEISDKWDALIDYKYSIAIENFQEPDWVTEKIYDCYLAYTIPVYHGSPNIENYFSADSMVKIDINDIEYSINQIEKALENDDHYDQHLACVIEARLKYLNEFNIFPLIVNFIKEKNIKSTNRKETITLKNKVEKSQYQILSQKFLSIEERLQSKIINSTPKPIRNNISQVINKVGNRLIHISQTVKPNEPTISNESIQARRCDPWFKDEGDKTHRLNYDLDINSLIFDLGGYEGQWASDIYAMYNCSVWIFEPYLPFANKIESRFKKNNKIQLFKFGLGARSEKVGLAVLDNSSSIYHEGPKKDIIEIVNVVEFLKTHSIQFVDLIKINIEGGEYELLEALLDHDLIKTFKNIQVQFHDFIIENAEERMKKIQGRLSLTHQLTYHYEFVWDNWKLKEND